jgi:hypothetical protein
MIRSLFSPEFSEQTSVPAGKLGASLQTYQHDLQTGLVEVDSPRQARHILLFARGQLVTAYRGRNDFERLAPASWLESQNDSSSKTLLRMLALTPQDVRIFKILIEQQSDTRCVIKGVHSLETQFAKWMEHPVPALAQVRWPQAIALVSFPGRGAVPYYTLFINANQILHSAGGLTEIYGWKESYDTMSLFSSEPRTLAWSEYLLHDAFSSLVSTLLGKFEKLIGRILLNQIIRDVNFKATAHDWNLSINDLPAL